MITLGTLNLTPKHYKKVEKVLKSNRLSYGPMTEQFESKVARMHKNRFGIMTNSGTSALQAVIHAMKILYGWKDGDEIIMPATTFVATYNVIVQNGLIPVLVDEGWDFNIDVNLINVAITERTRAILPVHLLGKTCDMAKILLLAKANNLKVIEDSCESFGVEGIGRGDATCFSFYAAHLLTTGVGGMVITKNEKLAELVRSLIFHGRDTKYLSIDDDDSYSEEVIKARFRFNYPGYSYRGTEVEAALGLVELETIEKNIKKRQENAAYLNSKLNNLHKKYFKNNSFMLYPIMSPKRNELMKELERNGIETRTIMPLITQPYLNIDTSKYPNAYVTTQIGLLVGCHQDLTKKDLDKIVEVVNG